MRMCSDFLMGDLSLSFSIIATFSFAILYIMISQASLLLSSGPGLLKELGSWIT